MMLWPFRSSPYSWVCPRCAKPRAAAAVTACSFTAGGPGPRACQCHPLCSSVSTLVHILKCLPHHSRKGIPQQTVQAMVQGVKFCKAQLHPGDVQTNVVAGDQATGLAILGNLATEKPWRAALAADDHSCNMLLKCVQHALRQEQPILQHKALNLLSNLAAASHICAQVSVHDVASNRPHVCFIELT